MEENNCAFQYWDGRQILVDKSELSLYQAKELFNEYYNDMLEKAKKDEEIEVAIWINMKNPNDYTETILHIYQPEVKNNMLVETQPKYYTKFEI